MAPSTIAILTEGDGEYASLDRLYKQIHTRTAARLISPLKVAVSPDAPPRRIALACAAPLKLSAKRQAESALLILDRERTLRSAGEVARSVEEEVNALDILPTTVVLKDRMYENWLVADIGGVASMRARFDITDAMKRRIEPDKADRCDALDLLKTAAIRKPYHKVHDAKRICDVMKIETAARNSRSFRRFLQVVGHRTYASQSSQPVDFTTGRQRRD